MVMPHLHSQFPLTTPASHMPAIHKTQFNNNFEVNHVFLFGKDHGKNSPLLRRRKGLNFLPKTEQLSYSLQVVIWQNIGMVLHSKIRFLHFLHCVHDFALCSKCESRYRINLQVHF